MFRTIFAFSLVIAGVSWSPAQAPTSQSSVVQPSSRLAEKEPGEAVPLTEPVITVQGICDPKPATGPCNTVITRRQFENLLEGLSQSGQPLRKEQRKALAEAYANFVAYAAAARKDGIEDNPQFKEFMIYQQLRVLAGIYKHVLEEKYKSPTPEDIKDYYEQHRKDFEEVNLRRLMIPKNNPGAKDKHEYARKASELAQDMQARAAQGEDLEDLQKESYQSLGLKVSAPSTQIGKRRRATLLPEEAEEIFSLRPGDASKLENESSSYVVYKVESRRTVPLDQVKGEISQLLFRNRLDGALKAITGSVHPELNPKYFVDPAPASSQNSIDAQAAPQTKL
jgi:hypothetical protein